MDNANFAHWIASWQPFYSTVATVASTLTGLLFIGLSINHDKLFQPERRPIRRLAIRSFGDYLFVLAIAIVLLIPGEGPSSLALMLVSLSGVRIVRIARDWAHPAYKYIGRRTLINVIKEYTFPIGSSAGLGVIGLFLRAGHPVALYAIVLIITELMITASRNAWHVLVLDHTE